MKVMIVDDDSWIREVIKTMIFGRKDSFFEYEDGPEAVQAFGKIRPDWVFMDYRLRRMDGITAMKEILAAHPNANIIIVTAFGDANVRDAALQAGARRYVAKEDLMEIQELVRA